MIKKINIALAVAFAVLLALKGVKSLMPERGKAAASAAKTEVRKGGDAPAVNVYYSNWTYFAQEDRISNRNGVCLDTLKAIFPNAVFKNLHMAKMAEYVSILANDPAAVLCTFGDHPDLKGFPMAPTPIAYSKIVLYTLRSNPWRYTGPESLEKLKIATTRDFLDFAFIRDLYERLGEDSARLKVYPTSTTEAELENAVESGEADAFVATGVKMHNALSADAAQQRSSTSRLKRFRFSSEIASDHVYLHTSSVDPEMSKRIIDAYEAGMKRIEANGERRRLFAYYDFIPEPVAEAPAKP